jgi:amino acid transporter
MISLHGWLSNFVLLDINIAIFGLLYFGYKFVMRTKIWKPEKMDFVTVSVEWWSYHDLPIDDLFYLLPLQGIPTPEETEMPFIPPKNIWESIAAVLFWGSIVSIPSISHALEW